MNGEQEMKVLISVDMEGISGIVDRNQTGRDQLDYQKGRDLMVGDINSAIDGILDFGEAEILVSDGHGWMKNIEPAKLNKAAILVRGTPKPFSQIAGIDKNVDAVIFVGYHSKRGTHNGILSHTYSGRTIDSLKVNGMEIGETAMNAAIAGYYGVPLIFVSGDLAVTKEAEEVNTKIITVAVKEAISRTAAKCLHPEEAGAMIRKGVKKALSKRSQIEPFSFKPPIELEVKYTNALMADAVAFMPSAERIDGRTIRFVIDDYLKAFGAFIASVLISSSVSS
jgi:D-amino peptidase